jgi:WD40 repeat protein
LKAHTAGVTSVAFSPEPEPTRILTGSEDYSAILWDAKTGQEVLTLQGHSQEVTSVAFAPDGRSALTGSRDGTAILWLTTDWKRPDDQLAVGETAASK